MYACVLETGRGFFVGGVRFRESASPFLRPTPPPCDSRMALCQHTKSEDSHHEFPSTAPIC
jgi:hypothetical protein